MQPPGAGSPVGTDEAPRPPLHDQGIGDGKVVKERFVGPLAGRVGRQAIGRVGWRAEAWRYGGESEMIEDLPDARRPLDHGDHLHRGPAARTQERIDLVHLPDEACPGAADV